MVTRTEPLSAKELESVECMRIDGRELGEKCLSQTHTPYILTSKNLETKQLPFTLRK